MAANCRSPKANIRWFSTHQNQASACCAKNWASHKHGWSQPSIVGSVRCSPPWMLHFAPAKRKTSGQFNRGLLLNAWPTHMTGFLHCRWQCSTATGPAACHPPKGRSQTPCAANAQCPRGLTGSEFTNTPRHPTQPRRQQHRLQLQAPPPHRRQHSTPYHGASHHLWLLHAVEEQLVQQLQLIRGIPATQQQWQQRSQMQRET